MDWCSHHWRVQVNWGYPYILKDTMDSWKLNRDSAGQGPAYALILLTSGQNECHVQNIIFKVKFCDYNQINFQATCSFDDLMIIRSSSCDGLTCTINYYQNHCQHFQSRILFVTSVHAKIVFILAWYHFQILAPGLWCTLLCASIE